MKLSVVIPTYRRVESLRRCLQALAAQTRLPDEILIVTREDDQESRDAALAWARSFPVRTPMVRAPGQVNALNTGVRAATGDVVSITDDDTAPRPDWLSRIENHFLSDSTIGGVGGRDWVHDGSSLVPNAGPVGSILFFGRVVGNHHLGSGLPRQVHFLKGANMSYRAAAIRDLAFDQHLRGKGAQVCNDMAFSMSVRRKGWKLIYDPEVAVDHYVAKKWEPVERGGFSLDAAVDAAFNQYWAISSANRPGFRRTMGCIWQIMVGDRSLPGFLHLALGQMRGDRHSWQRWKAANRGRMEARKLQRASR